MKLRCDKRGFSGGQPFPASFYFLLLDSNVELNMPTTGLDPGYPVIGSDRYSNWDTTTDCP